MANDTSTKTEIDSDEVPLIKVGSSSPPQNVAAAIAHHLYEGKSVKVRAIGAGAVNQAVKACAIAGGYCGSRAINLTTRIGFETVDGNEGTASAISILVTGS